MAINRTTLALVRDLRTTVGAQADDVVRDVTAAWLRAWDVLAKLWRAAVADLFDAARRLDRWPGPWEIARTPAVQRALAATDDALTRLAAKALTAVTAGTAAAITAAVAAEPAVIASQAPPAERDGVAAQAAAVILPAVVVAVAARAAQQVTVTVAPLAAGVAETIRRALTRNTSDHADAAAPGRMLAAVGAGFETGLTRAVATARTEILDAYRSASAYAHTANAAWLSGWRWLSALTATTCPSCWVMHGRTFPLAQAGPLDHAQGHCARVPVLRPWAQLGFGGRAVADQFPDARTRFDALPKAKQLQIMGARRLALINASLVDWDDLAVRRDDPGWRSSYTPTPLRDLERIAARRRAA